MVNVFQHRAFLTLYLHFLAHAYREATPVYTLQHAFQLDAVGSQHFHVLTDVVVILLLHLEGLSQSGRANLKLIILLIAVEPVFDETAQLHTVLDPHTVGVIDFHHNLVVATNLHINEEVLLVLKPLLNITLYNLLVNHTIALYKLK